MRLNEFEGGVVMKKWLFVLMVGAMTLMVQAQTLVIKGSNTVYPIAQLWVEEMQKMYPKLVVTLEGAGSTTGIKALFNETTDVANSSRFLKPSEIEEMQKAGRYFVPILIAYDALPCHSPSESATGRHIYRDTEEDLHRRDHRVEPG